MSLQWATTEPYKAAAEAKHEVSTQSPSHSYSHKGAIDVRALRVTGSCWVQSRPGESSGWKVAGNGLKSLSKYAKNYSIYIYGSMLDCAELDLFKQRASLICSTTLEQKILSLME